MKEKIIEFLKQNGITEVGFCKLNAEENPFGLGYAISYVVPLSKAVVDGITDEPTHTYFHHYRTVNTFIDNTSLKVGMMLAGKGYDYAAIPGSQSVNGLQAVFSHKYAASLSGLGTVGKSGLFLSEKFGPRVRLGTILTDYPFDIVNAEPKSICGSCHLCVDACPAMAIRGEEWKPGDERDVIIDAKACSDYMKKAFQHIGRGAVCGICMKVCKAGMKKSEIEKKNVIEINWSKPLLLEEALKSDLSNIQGLYYITRQFGHKETSLYLGIATKYNTVRHRLESHLERWLSEYRGKVYVRIGKIMSPETSDIYQKMKLIEHAESALLYEPEHKRMFPENASKRNTYTYTELYKVKNRGDRFELKESVNMYEHI